VRFSERHGYKAVRQAIQIDSISTELRNSLWSLLKLHVWDRARFSQVENGTFLTTGSNPALKVLCDRLWLHYFKEPLDTLSYDWSDVLPSLRTYFFTCSWHDVYDFVEFVANYFPFAYEQQDQFFKNCNAALEREVAGYRFVNGLITPITDEAQVAEIDAVLAGPEGPVRTHLRRGLELLADRKSPDYRNSIKESISAVESLVGTVLGEKGTLGQLIKKLETEIGLHPALRTAFSNLYGYTSDEDGIRHAIMEAKTVGFDEAKFFLVVCSAFVNFVDSKVAKP